MNDTIISLDAHGRKILTVKQLREVLDGLPDTVHVVAYDGTGDFNVSYIDMPNPGVGVVALTLYLGGSVDTRQF